MMKKCYKLMAAALMMLAAYVPAQAEQLTVFDETATNEYSPIYSYYYDTPGYIVQTILPEADLAQMKYTYLTSLKFYTSGDNQLNGGKLALSLGTTTQTTFSNFSLPIAVTWVAEVPMSPGGSEIEFYFKPFFYTGGNLVIETRVVEKGNYLHQFFLGKKSYVDNVLLMSYYNTYTSSFYPKTTFEYDLMNYLAILNTENIAFPMFYLGDEAVFKKTIKITNYGRNAFTPAFSGLEAPFGVEAVGEIASGETKDVVVTFAPDAIGEYAQTLTIDCGGAGLFQIDVTGRCVEAPEEMIIVKGSLTNDLIPVDPQNYDHVGGGSFTRMIYPKVTLANLVGKKITGIKFYTQHPMTMNGGNIQLLMGEEKYMQTFSDDYYIYAYDLDVVANAAPVAGETELVFNFDAPVEYTGDHLLLEARVTAGGDNGVSDKFLGINRYHSSLSFPYYEPYWHAIDFMPNATVLYLKEDTPDLVLRGDVDADGSVLMSDLSYLINYLVGESTPINYVNAAIMDSLDSDIVNMDDLTALINYLVYGYWAD